jgi:Protein of unknown function (DUF1403)
MVRTPQTPVGETLTLPPVPGWARNEPPVTDSDEAAFRAGAALAMLDSRVRADVRVPFAGVWRRRPVRRARPIASRQAHHIGAGSPRRQGQTPARSRARAVRPGPHPGHPRVPRPW